MSETRRVARGPLVVQLDPPSLIMAGRVYPVTPMQATALFRLVKDGSVSNRWLDTQHRVAWGSENGPRVMMVAIRRRLPPGVSIVSIKGWGYKLEIEDYDMVRDNMAKHIAGLPDDLQGAVIITRGADGMPSVSAHGIAPGSAIALIGQGITVVGSKIQFQPAAEADAAPTAEG